MSARRIHKPGIRVDASQPVTFHWNGQTCQGLAGDTLAAALLANGVRVVGQSYKYGRPRGILAAGCEEPNALVQLEDGGHATPNQKATQVELYPGLKARSSAIRRSKSLIGRLAQRYMPPGFYSKTFKWPQSLWPRYENAIRALAGFGDAPREADREWYDHLHHHVDVLVIGGGLCGLLAAEASARAGLKTLLVDEQNEPGGWLMSEAQTRFDDQPAHEYRAALLARINTLPNLEILSRCAAVAVHDHNYVQALEQKQDHLPPAARDPDQPRQRLHKIRARQILLASGGIDRPLVYGNNDLPGVMTLAAGQTYLNRYGVLPGESVLICGSHDGIYHTAADYAAAGASVTVADIRADAKAPAGLAANITVLPGYHIAAVRGRQHVEGARLYHPHSGEARDIAVETVMSSGGISPSVHLYCHDTRRPDWNEAAHAFTVPDDYRQSRDGIAGIGSVTGHYRWTDALAQTAATTRAALAALGANGEITLPRIDEAAETNPPAFAVRLQDGKPEGTGAKAFVDYQNDVTAADIAIAVAENYQHIEHVKRYTAFGFGTDQGKLTSVNSIHLTAAALGISPAAVSTTTYRPPWTPVTLGALAGYRQGNTFEPERTTALHPAHEARAAAMEAVGQWWRPWYFPQAGEDLHAAVARETAAVRNHAGAIDASTLGKIQIDGKDAREFLNRVYSNAWNKLEPGKCRYGLMLDENGMVMDDGVTACIHDNQFYMTTTTGGAARVLDWLERWHQIEWPELDVWLTSVTDHWATIAVVGPESRQILQSLCDDIDFSRDAFKFMEWRAGTVAGIAARVFRISFSGELAYEINVAAGYGRHIWEAVMAAGATPYGTETMHVLRAEKGFIIVGQDTDATQTPFDLGMPWAVNLKKPYSFLGQRSLARSDTAREGRKQLVGLLSADPHTVLPEGAQIIASADPAVPRAGSDDPPVASLGYITSSYHSVALGRSIAMANIENGAARQGETVYAFAHGKTYAATISSTNFVDPAGERQNA